MIKIRFEIKKPGPIAIRVVNVIGVPYYCELNTYDVQGRYDVNVSEENMIPGERYYYKIYDMEGMEDIPIESLNGSAKLIQSGNLKIGNNYINEV